MQTNRVTIVIACQFRCILLIQKRKCYSSLFVCPHHAKYYHQFIVYHRNNFMWLQKYFHASIEIHTLNTWCEFRWISIGKTNFIGTTKNSHRKQIEKKKLFFTLKNQTLENQYFDAYWMNFESRGKNPTWDHWWHCSYSLLASTWKSKQSKLHRRIILVKEMICFMHIWNGKVNSNNRANEEESVLVVAAGEHGNCGILLCDVFCYLSSSSSSSFSLILCYLMATTKAIQSIGNHC